MQAVHTIVNCIQYFFYVAGIGKAYEFGFPVISIFQMLAVLEIVNNLLGFVKGGVVPSMMQVINNVIILVIIVYYFCHTTEGIRKIVCAVRMSSSS